MGLFDDIRCKYPLGHPEVQDELFQTKDTPAQWLDKYEIREDGTLWHETYDTRIEESDDSLLGVRVYRDNPRWEQVPYVGELEMYTSLGKPPDGTWYSFRFWFRDGRINDVIASVGKLEV
ncbi:MAG: hypothetical protein ACE5GE_14315 [Phycisphaerae bacterium]